MSNHVRIRDWKRGGARSAPKPRRRKARPKTFKSEESAHAYAKANDITKYSLDNIRLGSAENKKIRIVF
ncbi:MAG: hypothetical protein KAS15_04330 [Nanoarchaeota archaeon]|nr:hypothetical protein [Nanoarchaeota archaeon]MCK5630231.1 hypothetical protein [Nanoarchaeota archaeon]